MDEPGLILYELADADPALRCRRERLWNVFGGMARAAPSAQDDGAHRGA